MIFNSNLSRIPSGKYPSLFAKTSSEMELFTFNETTSKFLLTTGTFVKCKTLQTNLPYTHMSKIAGGVKLFVCYNNNLSVIDNEEN